MKISQKEFVCFPGLTLWLAFGWRAVPFWGSLLLHRYRNQYRTSKAWKKRRTGCPSLGKRTDVFSSLGKMCIPCDAANAPKCAAFRRGKFPTKGGNNL